MVKSNSAKIVGKGEIPSSATAKIGYRRQEPVSPHFRRAPLFALSKDGSSRSLQVRLYRSRGGTGLTMLQDRNSGEISISFTTEKPKDS